MKSNHVNETQFSLLYSSQPISKTEDLKKKEREKYRLPPKQKNSGKKGIDNS